MKIFDEINTDASDNSITFEEFVIWATGKKLDLEDDLEDWLKNVKNYYYYRKVIWIVKS